MKIFKILILFFVGIIFYACDKDDEQTPEDLFYANALTSVKMEDIAGNWAMSTVEYNGEISIIQPSRPECGSDFTSITSDGKYREYIYSDSYNCTANVITSSWKLNNGILTIIDANGKSDEIVIIKATDNTLIFKIKMDVSASLQDQIFSFTAHSYTPAEDKDLYSDTFEQNTNEEHIEQIEFNWQTYVGVNGFERYEIYRSTTLSKNNATLIKTIDDIKTNSFIDLDPPIQDKLYYYFKIYNENGLLGESELQKVFTGSLHVREIFLKQPTVVNQQVELEWEESQSPYFSNYTVLVYGDNPDAQPIKSEGNTQILKKIYEKETLNFTDEFSYIKNPVYIVYVEDIFGNTSIEYENLDLRQQVDFEREGLIDLYNIEQFTHDPKAPYIYLNGLGEKNGTGYNIIKYNYETKKVVAKKTGLRLYSGIEMKLINSDQGNELFVNHNGNLHIYDADNLNLLHENGESGYEITTYSDFEYIDNGIYLFVNKTHLISYRRDSEGFSMIDSKPHFDRILSTNAYHLIPTSTNNFLLGHKEINYSLNIEIDDQGLIDITGQTAISIQSQWKTRTLYEPATDELFNLDTGDIFLVNQTQLVTTNSAPEYFLGWGKNATELYAANHDDISTNYENFNKQLIVIKRRNQYQYDTYPTLGYPMATFNDYKGKLIIISSYFKREELDSYTSCRANFFIEPNVSL